MDVDRPRPGRHRRGGRAARHRAHRGAARRCSGGCRPAPILCFDGDAAGQKAAVRAALRALPHVGPGRSLGFVTLPAGQDPDDLSAPSGRDGARGAAGQARAAGRPALAPRARRRAARHARAARRPPAPAARPCRRDRRSRHPRAISRRVARPLRRPRRAAAAAAAGLRRRARPLRAAAPALGRGQGASAAAGIDAELGRAVLAGLVRFPDLIADHVEAIAACRLPDRDAARLRDMLLEAALAHGALDKRAPSIPYWPSRRGGSCRRLRLERGLAFSFTRRDAEPERARAISFWRSRRWRPGRDSRRLWRRRRRG